MMEMRLPSKRGLSNRIKSPNAAFGKEVSMRKYRLLQPILFLMGTVCLLGSLFLTRCTFEEPTLPKWQPRFVIPLIDKTYTMADLSDETDIIDTVNQQVVLKIEQDIETFEIGDQLAVKGANRILNNLPAGSIQDSVALPVDSVLVESATIKSGTVTLRVNNQNNSQVHIRLEMPDLKAADGATVFTVDRDVEHTTPNFPTDLAGYVFTPREHNGINYVRFSAELTEGAATVTVTISDLVFSSVTGKLKDVTVAMEDTETEIKIPEEYKGFQIQSAHLNLTLYGLPFQVIVRAEIQALEYLMHDRPAPAPIVVQDTIPPSSQYGDQGYTISLPPDVAANFINSLPTRILMRGSISIKDSVHSATVSETTAISGVASLQAPLTFTIPYLENTSVINSFEMDEDARKDIGDVRENFVQGEIGGEITNNLPIGIDSVVVCFAKDSLTIFNNPDLSFGLRIKSATVSGDPGVATAPQTSDLHQEIWPDDLKLFEENAVVYYATKFIFPGTQGMVRIRPQDYIRVQAHVAVQIKSDIIEKDDEE